MREYFPKLDGIRGLAVTLVLIHHFVPAARGLWLGEFGVYLFFVLSGFLITRILLAERQQPEQTRAKAIKFYARRAMRLTPALVISLAVGGLLHFWDIRQAWPIHILYLTNFKVAIDGQWDTTIPHFWSLAVEEQFYLLWFATVIMLPRRFLPAIIIGGLCISPIFRFVYCKVFGGWFYGSYVLLPGCTEFLCSGALLALLEHHKIKVLIPKSVLIAMPFFAGGVFATLIHHTYGSLFYGPTGLNILAFCIVAHGRYAATSLFSFLPLRLLGKISYGVYVYHLFVALIFARFAPNFVSWPILIASTIAVAWVSWTLVERPLLQRKFIITAGRHTVSDLH